MFGDMPLVFGKRYSIGDNNDIFSMAKKDKIEDLMKKLSSLNGNDMSKDDFDEQLMKDIFEFVPGQSSYDVDNVKQTSHTYNFDFLSMLFEYRLYIAACCTVVLITIIGKFYIFL